MKNKRFFLIILAAFIIIQPLIDVLTMLSKNYSEGSITVGIIIRTFFMLVIIGWITYAALHSKEAKKYFFYLAGLAVLLIVNLVVNYLGRDPETYNLIEELSYFFKIVYFPVLFFGLVLVLKEMKLKGTDSKKQLVNYFLLSSLIISAVFIIAQLTGTSIKNYSWSKEGWSGWFNAGNEIGATMAILLPITALYAAHLTNSVKDIFKWIPFILLSISMLALGTKVGYGGIIIVLLSVFVGSIIMLIWKNATERKEQLKANLLVSFILLILLVVVTPFTPVFGNMFTHFDILGISIDKPDITASPNEEKTEAEEKASKENIEITGAQFENLIFSSREVYVERSKKEFMSASNTRQLFGLGNDRNHVITADQKLPKLIEMDFHDWFFSFGLLGFIYLISPLLWYSGRYIYRFFKEFKSKFDYFHILTGISFLLGIGIAYTAGHVFTAPSVSIYMAFLLAIIVIYDDNYGKIAKKI